MCRGHSTGLKTELGGNGNKIRRGIGRFFERLSDDRGGGRRFERSFRKITEEEAENKKDG